MGSSSQQVTVRNIASQDAASKSLAAAHRVDEAEQLYRKAEAVWVYAQRSGDSELQSEAAEIRLFAQRRAGELMAEMTSHPGSRGPGRPRRDEATEEIGVTEDRSSKWQQIEGWMRALLSKSRVGGNVVPGASLFFSSHPAKASLNELRVALPVALRYEDTNPMFCSQQAFVRRKSPRKERR